MSRSRDTRSPAPRRSAPLQYRSLEQLAGDPRVRELEQREFPPGASELPTGIDRRQLVTLVGASLSMAGLAACRRPVERIVPFVEAPEQVIPGIPRHYATTMPFGHSAYGVVVESHEGRPTKIEGNELHPSSLGSSSLYMQASILDLYDPDRSRQVRSGEEESSWEEFTAAWAKLEGDHLGDGGAGLAIVSRAFTSPTLARLWTSARERFPQARFVVHEPVSDESIVSGLERATGEPLLPLHHFDRARVIVAIDSDFLFGDAEGVRNTRAFAAGRRVTDGREEMSRLYAVEGAHSLTGGNADHRFRVPSSCLGAFVLALARELASQGLELELPAGEPAAVPGVDGDWLRVVASDLLAHRGTGLLIAGRRQPAEVHAAVFALNQALGNVGATVDYRRPDDAGLVSASDFADLVAAMAAGEIETLLVMGANPVYDAPADLDFAGALEQVATLIHLGTHRDETGNRADWHLPEAHFLESWGDARAADGTASLIQPLIEPLFGGRTGVELMGLLASGFAQPSYDLVRETWRPLLAATGEEGFESAWNRVLHDGLLTGSASAPSAPQLASATASPFVELAGVARTDSPSAENLEIVFEPSPALFDGRFANNGWLQELPDPLTKLTWDNAALMSPATAAALGLENEEVVRLDYRGRSLELPVWLIPGQADATVVVNLGYGREAGGRIATGVGGSAYRLRTAAAPDVDRGLVLEPTGRRHALAQTQDHWGMEARPIVVEGSLEHYRHEPEFAREAGPEKPHESSMWDEWTYDRGYQWGMAIDLNACVGCNACVIACQSENNVPVVGREQVRNGREMHWLRIDRYFSGSPEEPVAEAQTLFQPMPCMQCENAPCEQVCPVAATVHDGEGLNVMVYNRCIGTRYCSNNCPYKVRRFNFFNFTKDTPELMQLANNPDVTVRSRGVMEKCTYCTQRINAARIRAKLEGRPIADGDIRTACQQACPAEAITFGNIRDPESRVVKMKGEPRNYALLNELHTKPRTTFLAKLRNPHPDLAPAAPAGHGADEGGDDTHA